MKISQKNLTRIIVLIGAAIYNFVLFLVLAGREKNAVFPLVLGRGTMPPRVPDVCPGKSALGKGWGAWGEGKHLSR